MLLNLTREQARHLDNALDGLSATAHEWPPDLQEVRVKLWRVREADEIRRAASQGDER
jgi:hypothetical protein